MPDIGNTLREARIRRGLTLTDVENVTKIRAKYLEALEENDFEVLPGATVVKGFLRSYAVFLKIDDELLLSEYRSQYETRRDDPGALRAELARQRRASTTSYRQKKTRRAQPGYVAAAVLAIVAIIAIAWLGAGRGKGQAVLEAGSPATSSSVAATVVTAGTVGVPTTVVDKTSSTTAAGSSTTAGKSPSTTTGQSAAGEDVTMVLTVTEGSCWLVVREDGEGGAELYAGTLSAGGQQTFDSAKRYWVMAGIPEALSISVNGTPHTVAGGAGKFLITETGVERDETEPTQTTG